MNYKAIYLIVSALLMSNAAQSAEPLEFCGKRVQGGLVVVHKDNVYKVLQNGKEVPVSEDGDFLLAFDRDAPLQQKIVISANIPEEDYPEDNYTFTIIPTKWDVQKVNGVAQSKVTPSQKDSDEILRENQSVRIALTENNSDKSYWKSGFIEPLDDYRISGQFGGQRIINKIPKSPHRGMDMAAPEGTEIKAAADGVVKLGGGDFFYSGNMVIIDHGQSLHTMYAHMKDVKVKKGDFVKQGEVIGTVGKTGRATGPHLHWGASFNNVRFNPEHLLELGKKEYCEKI